MKTIILDIMAIPLTQGLFALVDGRNYERISRYAWHADKNRNGYYARRSYLDEDGKCVAVRMHREVHGTTAYGKVLDHINHNGLDNREQNIRPCTNRQNLCNTEMSPRNKSGYRGVCRVARLGKWLANISHEGHTINLGAFTKPEDAARAFDEAAVRYRGEYAKLNFPGEHKDRAIRKSPVYGGGTGNQLSLWS